MFRNKQKSKILPENFGAGSILIAGNLRWLVISDTPTTARLVSLNNFITSHALIVDDPNYLTEDETRKLVDLTELNYTFSDFEFDTKGLK